MTCSQYDTLQRAVVEGEFMDAFVCLFTDGMGASVYPVLFFAPLAIALYFVSRSIEVPIVVLIITGTVILTQLPAAFANAAMLMLVVGLAAGVWLVTMRLQRE